MRRLPTRLDNMRWLPQSWQPGIQLNVFNLNPDSQIRGGEVFESDAYVQSRGANSGLAMHSGYGTPQSGYATSESGYGIPNLDMTLQIWILRCESGYGYPNLDMRSRIHIWIPIWIWHPESGFRIPHPDVGCWLDVQMSGCWMLARGPDVGCWMLAGCWMLDVGS